MFINIILVVLTSVSETYGGNELKILLIIEKEYGLFNSGVRWPAVKANTRIWNV
jgi:hypothetical protein